MLERVEFIRKAQLILGGRHRPTSKFSPVAMPDVPFLEEETGDVRFWRDNGRRITIPAEACKVKYRADDLSIAAPPIPTTTRYEIESVFFAPDVSVYLDQLSTVDSWHRDKHHRDREGHVLTDATVHDRVVTITRPKGGTVDVPFRQVLWYVEVPVAELEIPRDAFPVGEVTPSDDRAALAPAKRAARKS